VLERDRREGDEAIGLGGAQLREFSFCILMTAWATSRSALYQ
jgi:hypothetical protein